MAEQDALKPLNDMTREELNAHASTLGIAEPEKYPNKAELTAAIEGNFGDGSTPEPEPIPTGPVHRYETYEATRPNGEKVRVTRNIDTGDQKVEAISGKASGGFGVPMLPGSGKEPVGPEDALGIGATRGDYRDRIGSNTYQPHEGTEPQRTRAEEIGDVAGLKGGVQTADVAK